MIIGLVIGGPKMNLVERLKDIEKLALRQKAYDSYIESSPFYAEDCESPENIILMLISELRAALEKEKIVLDFVNEQAEDEALWSLPCDSDGRLKLQPIGEAYLQQELRRLHEVIEQNFSELDRLRGGE